MEKNFKTDLEKELEAADFRSHAIYVAGKLLSAGLDLHKLADMVMDMFVELMRVDLGYLMLFDEKSRDLRVKAVKGLKQKHIRNGTSIKIEKDAVKRIIDWKKPILLSGLGDLTLKEFFCTMSEKINYGISLYVPLVIKDRFIGLINFGEKEFKEPFSQKDLELLSAMCAYVAIAIENARLYEAQINNYLNSVVSSLANAVEVKDPYTRGHSERVSIYAVSLARGMDFSESEIEGIRIASVLHDIGKIGVPEGILLKFAPLTDAEIEVIKDHPVVSAKIIKGVVFPWDVISVVLHHHEQYDGSGYPNGLKGEDIPLGARILAVADTYEALLADRPYRRGFPKEKGLEIIREVAGLQLDPKIVLVFLDLVEKGKIE